MFKIHRAWPRTMYYILQIIAAVCTCIAHFLKMLAWLQLVPGHGLEQYYFSSQIAAAVCSCLAQHLARLQ